MRPLNSLLIVGGLWLCLIVACNVPEDRTRSEQPAPSPSTASSAISEIDRALGISAGYKPVYKLLETKDVSTATATRKVMNVSLPKGLDKEAIGNNLRYAAKELYEKEKPDALEVYAYLEGRTIDSSNSLGKLTFAPYGDWARAAEKASLDNYRAVVEGRNPYLPPIENEAPVTDSLEKQALSGDYQAQRNLAYYLSTGAEGHSKNPVMACAWRIVILKSGGTKVDDSDRGNKSFDCDQKLTSQQLSDAETQAATLLKKMKKR
jgi:hypothetical protein